LFDIDPIVWLQSWASSPLTAFMNGVSLLGYTRAYVAIATFLAFALRLRSAIALLVLIALSGALTDIAKATAAAPRPDWAADGTVKALSLFGQELRERDADSPTEVEDDYGFPSGHVSATTAFMVGLALLLKWRWRGWSFAVGWILLMALSRVYLGRHFFGDTLGGVAVGLTAVAIGFAALQLSHLAAESRAHHPWPAHRVMTVAIVLAGGALLVGLPDAGDAGRLLGTAIGVLVLVHHDVFEAAITRRARVILLFTAIFGFGAAWGVMSLVLRYADPSSASALRLAASVLPNAALLVLPAYLPRRILDARVFTHPARNGVAPR
jgi:membrane-associated phospholipid phosphatase